MPTALELARRALTADAAKALDPLEKLGFADPVQALETLDRIGGPPQSAPLPALALAELAATGRTDEGLRQLVRLAVAYGPRGLFSHLEADPILCQRLVQVVSHSTFLADILVRDFEFLLWLLVETPHLVEPLERSTLRQILRTDIGHVSEFEERLEVLRRVHRREFLRIGAAEILGTKPVAQIGKELADLADVVVEVALETCQHALWQEHGQPLDERGRPARFLVVGLGKYGGQELNYSSDIDLIFVWDGEGETQPEGEGTPLENSEFFRRLGQRLVQVLTEATREGFFYRVDMRLRPEGASGTLIHSLRASWRYYETRGELWERQMLIKARRVAGSRTLGEQYAAMLCPFIYPAHFHSAPHEEIRRIKERIEASIRERPRGENNIKLQAGGIRDIEFIVQCLQLLYGGIQPQARSHNTLAAIDRLAEVVSPKGAMKVALTAAEASALKNAYEFFRRVENLLQIASGRPDYAVPEDAQALRALALVMGYKDARAFSSALAGHRLRVRRLFAALFYGATAAPRSPTWLLEVENGSAAAKVDLVERGFVDGAAAHRRLQRLAGMGLLLSGGRAHFEALLPELLNSLAAAPDPDQGLLRFTQLVEAYGAPGALYSLLQEHTGFRTLIIAICGSSRFLADLLRRDPALLDSLVSQASQGLEPSQVRGDLHAIARMQNKSLLRIGADDLMGLATEEETFLRLTELGEEVLQAVYGLAWRPLVRRWGKPRNRQGRDVRFAVLAGGKFGGREVDFGSDLDLFFVYEGDGKTRRGVPNSVFFTEFSQRLIALLAEEGLYSVDARLRPEGASAPMAISLVGYRRYLAQRAASWERMALSRARQVAGDAEFGAQVLRAIERFVYSREVEAALVAQMQEMRQRMEPQGKRQTRINIKRGPGGIVDIEFVAQVLVLKWGYRDRGLRVGSTRHALQLLVEQDYLDPERGRFLLDAYEYLRAVEKGMRLASERASDALPTGRELEILSRALGAKDVAAFQDEVEACMQQTRRVFSALFAELTN